MLNIQLEAQIAKKLEQGMRTGDAVELPFPVVYIWALNGQPGYKSQGDALYFGGWACKREDVEVFAEHRQLSIPEDWKPVVIPTRDGDEYEAYVTRSVIVAPIGKRASWLLDGQRHADYVPGSRRHLQVLAYLAENRAENGENHFEPWGPVVLTAKGYQARNLRDAFNQWNKATSFIRWQVAPGVPAWCFYLALGTFGRERDVVNVGKPGAQSPITPIKPYIPERFDEALIGELFVGEELAGRMADLQGQAEDWLSAWADADPAEDEFEGDYPEEEDEIPF